MVTDATSAGAGSRSSTLVPDRGAGPRGPLRDRRGAADPAVGEDGRPLYVYSRSFYDRDGHHWEILWMDSVAVEQGPAVVTTSA